MDAAPENLPKSSIRPFLYYLALGLLPVWVVAAYVLYDSQYGLTLPWFLLFLPITFFMAAIGFSVHMAFRRSLDAVSSYALGTTVYFAIPLTSFLISRVL